MPQRGLLRQFADAGRGVWLAWRQEGHVRFHTFAAAAAFAAGAAVGLSEAEWLWLGVAVVLVITLEVVNAAAERAVDLAAAGKMHRLARDAKDVAAGAVLLAAVHAVLGGAYVFFGRHGLREVLADLWRWPGASPWGAGSYSAVVLVGFLSWLGGERKGATLRVVSRRR